MDLAWCSGWHSWLLLWRTQVGFPIDLEVQLKTLQICWLHKLDIIHNMSSIQVFLQDQYSHFYLLRLQPFASSLSLRKASCNNPRQLFSHCMQNDVTSVRHKLSSFHKKHLYTTTW